MRIDFTTNSVRYERAMLTTQRCGECTKLTELNFQLSCRWHHPSGSPFSKHSLVRCYNCLGNDIGVIRAAKIQQQLFQEREEKSEDES